MATNTVFVDKKTQYLKDSQVLIAVLSQVKPELHLHRNYLDVLKCSFLGSTLNRLNHHA